MRKKLGIVGAGGFFGLSFVDAFLAGDLDAFGIDKLMLISRSLSPRLSKLSQSFPKKLQFIQSDISALESLPSCDFWLHFATSSSIQRYQINAALEFENNTHNLKYFMKLVAKSKEVRSVLFASSGAVYEQSLAGLSETSPLIAKTSILHPDTAYAQSKLLGEQMVEAFAKEIGINYSIARCFAFCGFHLPLSSHFAVGNFVRDIVESRHINVKATHPVYRSYLHTDDLVRWLMVMLSDCRASGHIFNVGAADAVSLRDLAEALANHFDGSTKLPNSDAEYYSHVPTSYFPDVAKAKRLLDLEQSESTVKAVIRMAQMIKRPQT